MRLPQIAMVVMLAVAAVQIADYYPQLPSVVAGHFNAAGAPDSWQPKGFFFGLMGSVYMLFAFLYWAVPLLILSMPHELINVPNRSYWLAPERRLATAHMIGDQMAWFGAAQIGFIIVVCQLAINANLPGGSGTLTTAIWWALGMFLAFAAIWLIRFTRMFRRPAV